MQIHQDAVYIYDYNATESDVEKYTQNFKNEIKQVNVEKTFSIKTKIVFADVEDCLYQTTVTS